MDEISEARLLAEVLTPSLLRSTGSFAEHERLCRSAALHGLAAIAVTPAQVGLFAYRLAGTSVRVGTVVSFPLGQTSITAKVWETDHVLAYGASEVGFVVNAIELCEGNRGYVATEMQHVVDACRAAGAVPKVVVETGELTAEQVREVCDIATDVRPDLFVAGTGFLPHPAPPDVLELVRRHLHPEIGIEVAAPASTIAQVRALRAAGADRVLSGDWSSLLTERA
jgi:deoxyribose-phosphate aldolase